MPMECCSHGLPPIHCRANRAQLSGSCLIVLVTCSAVLPVLVRRLTRRTSCFAVAMVYILYAKALLTLKSWLSQHC